MTLYYYKNIEDAKPRGSIPLIEDKYHIGPPKEQRRGYDHAFRLDVDQPTSLASPRSDERGRNRKKYSRPRDRGGKTSLGARSAPRLSSPGEE